MRKSLYSVVFASLAACLPLADAAMAQTWINRGSTGVVIKYDGYNGQQPIYITTIGTKLGGDFGIRADAEILSNPYDHGIVPEPGGLAGVATAFGFVDARYEWEWDPGDGTVMPGNVYVEAIETFMSSATAEATRLNPGACKAITHFGLGDALSAKNQIEAGALELTLPGEGAGDFLFLAKVPGGGRLGNAVISLGPPFPVPGITHTFDGRSETWSFSRIRTLNSPVVLALVSRNTNLTANWFPKVSASALIQKSQGGCYCAAIERHYIDFPQIKWTPLQPSRPGIGIGGGAIR